MPAVTKKKATPAAAKLQPGSLKRISVMAEAGARDVDIASALAMTPDQFAKLRQRDARVERAYQKGREGEHVDLWRAAKRLAMSDSPQAGPMLRFLLESRHGYKSGEADQAPRIGINITLPDSVSLEEYRKLVTVEPVPTESGQPAKDSALRKLARA